MWNLNTQARLQAWFEFRKSLTNIDFLDAVHKVNQLWHSAPISKNIYTADSPKAWPGPWQLVVDNFYDNIARALGMLYTLYYSKHKCPIEIHCYRSKEESWEAALVWIDNGKYVLNWDLEVQVNTKLQLGKATLIQRQTIEDLLTNESNSSYKKKWP